MATPSEDINSGGGWFLTMAITRQAYEWRGVVTTGTTVCRTGHPVLGDWTAADGTAGGPTTAYNNTISVPAFEGGMPLDIMWGGKGNNLRTSATTKENQLLILDGLACWPGPTSTFTLTTPTTSRHPITHRSAD